MFVPVTFRLGDTTKYSRGFEMLSTRAKDLTEPLTAIGARLIRSIGAQFATEGSWAGTPWRPLTDTYAAWKEEHWPGRPLLVRTGAMRGDMLDAGRSLKIMPTRLIYTPADKLVSDGRRETNVADIAGYHQDGTDRMVARPLVELPLAELREYDRLFVRWLAALDRGPLWGVA